MLHGYSFYPHKKALNSIIWSCTGSQCCKARLKLVKAENVKDRRILDVRTEHCHKRPSYFINTDGFYEKL